MGSNFCAKSPLATLCLEKKAVTIKFVPTSAARFIKRETELETCSQFPEECKPLQKKVGALFSSGLKLPINQIASVGMYQMPQEGGSVDATIVIEFSKQLSDRLKGRSQIRLSGFHPRPLERVVKAIIPEVERNRLLPNGIDAYRLKELTDSNGVIRFMPDIDGKPPTHQSILVL